MEQEVYRIAITVQQKISDRAVGEPAASSFWVLTIHYYPLPSDNLLLIIGNNQ